jgi:hypothetical protein
MRVTKKLLVTQINELLQRMETDFVVISIQRSRFRGHEYEGGA